MAQRPSKEEVEEWVSHPVTKWKLSKLSVAVADLSDKVISGGTLADAPGLTAQLTAREVGEAAGVRAAISILEDEEE